MGFPWIWVPTRHARSQRTRMMGLPDGPKSFKIGLAALTQYRRVTDGRTDGHRTTEKTELLQSVGRVKVLHGHFSHAAPAIWNGLAVCRSALSTVTLISQFKRLVKSVQSRVRQHLKCDLSALMIFVLNDTKCVNNRIIIIIIIISGDGVGPNCIAL